MNRTVIFLSVFISIILIAEIGSYMAMRTFITTSTGWSMRKFNWIWWVGTLFLYAFGFSARFFAGFYLRNVFINVFFFILFCKLFIGLTFFIASLWNLIRSWIFSVPSDQQAEVFAGRRAFVSKLALGSALLPFTTLSWGLIRTAYHFKIHRVKINSPKLHAAFNGFRIVQISDIHTGSLQGEHQLQKAIDLIQGLKPDLIVFTGDLVNNETAEAKPYAHILKQLHAPYGVFSTLGNHDYGDYQSWESKEAKDQNLRDMIDFHGQLGWKLMLNEHQLIERNGQSFTLIGIENWGGNLNFKRYGDMKKAYQGVKSDSFQLLLSHDPSHWSVEVSKDYKDIDLTLSGHTHGFQFGVEIPGFKWSPSQYFYPQWAGLYGNSKQRLYVNRGLGCIGYMGRIGIRPEISVIELEAEA